MTSILQLTSALCFSTKVGKAASTVTEEPPESSVQRPRAPGTGMEDGRIRGWGEGGKMGGR